MHISATPRFVEPKVKTLALEKRKHIVKERVAVGKLHQGANRHHQDVRLETLVSLYQPYFRRTLRRRRNRNTGTIDRSQPEHNVSSVMCANCIPSALFPRYTSGHRGTLGAGDGTTDEHGDETSQMHASF